MHAIRDRSSLSLRATSASDAVRCDREYRRRSVLHVGLGASVSIAADQEPEAYGATLIRFHDAAWREVRSEVRGRELDLLDIVLFVELEGVSAWRPL
jgi:hypothetical protein